MCDAPVTAQMYAQGNELVYNSTTFIRRRPPLRKCADAAIGTVVGGLITTWEEKVVMGREASDIALCIWDSGLHALYMRTWMA